MAILDRDGWACVDCGRGVDYDHRGRLQLEVDHVVPRHAGGGDEHVNLQVLCVPCHKQKTRVDVGLQPKDAAWQDLIERLI